MSKRPGFTVMDIDVAIADDPKFKLIARTRPEHLEPAFMAYVALLGESWKAAERATIADGWPSLLPFDEAVVATMTTVRLLDKTGRVPVTAWRKRFTDANRRRIRARERYNRYNAKRGKSGTNDDGDTTSQPRGSDAITATTEPNRSEPFRTVPSSPPEKKTHTPRARNGAAPTDPYDQALTWLAGRHAWVRDGSNLSVDLARMVDRKGVDVVIAAMAGVEGAEDAAQFVYGAKHALFPLGGSVVEGDPDPDDVKRQLRARREGQRASV